PLQGYCGVGGADLDAHAPPSGLFRSNHLSSAAQTGLKAHRSRFRVLAHGPSEELGRLFCRVGVADGPARTLPIAFPYRCECVAIIAVVIGLVPLLPTHEAGLMPPRPERIGGHGKRLHPDGLLVV